MVKHTCYNHHKSKDALNIFLQIPPKIVHNLDPLIYPSVPAHNLCIRHIYQTIFHYLHLIQLQILQHLFDICCFLYERDVAYRNSNDSTERFEIRIILRRIYITVAWELVLQIKAFTDDKEKDCLTVDKFKSPFENDM